MQQNQSPIAAIKQICASKKMLYLSLVYTFVALCGSIAVFRSSIDLTAISILGLADINLAEYLGRDLLDILRSFMQFLFVIQIIGILPDVLTAVSFWMIRSGTAPGNEASVRINRGLIVPRLLLFAKGLGKLFMGMGALILAIFAAVTLGSATAKIGPAMLVVLVGLLIFGFFAVGAFYYMGLANILFGITRTLQTGKNVMTCGRFLRLFNWILAIVTILTAFGKAPLALITTLLEAAVYICIALLLSDIKQRMGFRTKEEAQAVFYTVLTTPAYAATADILGVARPLTPGEKADPKMVLRVIGLSFFGTKVAPIEGELVAAGEGAGKTPPAEVAPVTPSVEQPAAEPHGDEPIITHTSIGFTFSGGSSVSSAEPTTQIAAASTAQPVAVARPAVGADAAVSLLASQALCLFDARMEEIPDRYSVLGDTEYECGAGCPLPLYRVQVLKDKISEKKLLRLAFYAPSVPVVGARMNILLGGVSGEAVGIIRDLCFTEEYLGEEMRTATLGFLLPDGVAVGEVTVTSVSLADGLDWEKGSTPYAFSVQKKETVAAYESAEAVRASYACAPSISARTLALFSSSPSELAERYTLLGELKLAPAEDGPLHLQAVQMVRDGVSEKKLLRLSFYPSSLPIVGARIDIVLRNAHADIIGVIRDFSLTEEHIDADGNIQTAHLGFLLPDDAASGEILVASVSLSDGLLWAKGSAYYSFTTEETRVVDVEHFCRTVGAEIPSEQAPNLLTYRIAKADAYVRSVCVCEGENAYLEVTCLNSGNMVIRRLSLAVTYTDANGCEISTEPVLFEAPLAPTHVTEVLRLPLPQGVKEGTLYLRVAQDSFMRPVLADSVPFATYDRMAACGAAWRRNPAAAPTTTASATPLCPTGLDTPTAGEPTLTASATPSTEPSANGGKQSVLPLVLAIAAALLSFFLIPSLY